MKCPKCGYNSFEHYDSCKKCSHDLTGYKATFGLKAIVLPLDARTSMAAALMAETAAASPAPEEVEAAAIDMFSFDLPEDEAATTPETGRDNPFDFDEETGPAKATGGEFSFDEDEKSPQAKAEEDAFASLLESTSLEDKTVAPKAEGSAKAAAGSSPGEFDLDNFSWDDTPETPAGGASKADDDFNSLFGDLEDTTKK